MDNTTADNTTAGSIVENTTAAPPDDRDQKLDRLRQELIQYQRDCDQSYLEMGRLLLKVKLICGKHGEWIPWIKANTELSVCKAQRLMRTASWIDANEAPVPHLDFTKAYILSRLPKNEAKDFLKNFHFVGGNYAKNVESMTKRELEIAVRNHLRSKNRKSSTVPETNQSERRVSVEDKLLDRFGRIKSDVSELATLVGSDSAGYGAFASELCELCQDIIQRLSPEDLESA